MTKFWNYMEMNRDEEYKIALASAKVKLSDENKKTLDTLVKVKQEIEETQEGMNLVLRNVKVAMNDIMAGNNANIEEITNIPSIPSRPGVKPGVLAASKIVNASFKN